MKKYIILFILLFLTSILIIVKTKDENTNKINQETTSIEALYILKEHNGLLAVYKSNTISPIKVYDIQVHTLPENDIERLENGICVYNETELYMLINDFTS